MTDSDASAGRQKKRREKGSKTDSIPYYREIREALGQSGCAFCRMLIRDADRYLDSVLWELVNDSQVRAELNLARGYCQQHGWMLVRSGGALGVAIMMDDVLKTLLDVMSSNAVGPRADSVFKNVLSVLQREDVAPPGRGQQKERAPQETAGLVAALSPQTSCPACARLAPREKSYAKVLMSHLEGPNALGELYDASDGLCLAHFRLALANTPSPASAQSLVDLQRSVWERLEGELSEFIRKNDHRFRHEKFGEEKDSWRRALEAVSGPQPLAQSARQGLTQSV